jgi:hypothetical protein
MTRAGLQARRTGDTIRARDTGDRFVFDPPKEYRRGTKGVYEPPRDILKAYPA